MEEGIYMPLSAQSETVFLSPTETLQQSWTLENSGGFADTHMQQDKKQKK